MVVTADEILQEIREKLGRIASRVAQSEETIVAHSAESPLTSTSSRASVDPARRLLGANP